MRICLIDPETRFGDPPLGLAYIAAHLRQKIKDVDIEIIEKKSEKQILNEIKGFSPDIIGITSVSKIYYLAKSIAKKIRKIFPKVQLVIGGIHITTSPNSFDKSPFDIAVVGEGEITFTELIKSYKDSFKNIDKVKGLLIRKNGKFLFTGRRKLPMPAFDLLNMDYYLTPKLCESGLKIKLSLITSRGCPYNCSFCNSANIWERRVRFHTPHYVVKMIKKYIEEYKVDIIDIYDDLFSLDTVRLREIIILMKQERLLGKVNFEIQERTNLFSEEKAELLKELGVTAIAFGIETASPKILNYLKGDNITVKDHQKAIDLAKKYRFNINAYFMVGNPYETKEDLGRTYNFIKKNNLIGSIFFQTVPFPGTKIWDYAIKKKIINKNFYENKPPEIKWGYDLPIPEADLNMLLSKEITKEEFIGALRKFRELIGKGNKKLPYKQLLKFKNLKYLFDKRMLKKIWRYKGVIIKRL